MTSKADDSTKEIERLKAELAKYQQTQTLESTREALREAWVEVARLKTVIAFHDLCHEHIRHLEQILSEGVALMTGIRDGRGWTTAERQWAEDAQKLITEWNARCPDLKAAKTPPSPTK